MVVPLDPFSADFEICFRQFGETNCFTAKDSDPEGIPVRTLRRMGKAVRMGVGNGLGLLKHNPLPSGIILGTANGGMEDCIKFLNQIIEFKEGTLTPTNFVQSTPNAVSSQLAMSIHNHGYNITHVHRGLAFEMALQDTWMLCGEKPQKTWLVGGLDEISDYNYRIEAHDTAYKPFPVSPTNFFGRVSPGSTAGEGSAMFLVNGQNPEPGEAEITWIHTETGTGESGWREVEKFYHRSGSLPDLLISGENGDSRLKNLYSKAEIFMPEGAGISRFKHCCGEFPTASAMALHLASTILKHGNIPEALVKKPILRKATSILIYNTYKGEQHGWIMISKKI